MDFFSTLFGRRDVRSTEAAPRPAALAPRVAPSSTRARLELPRVSPGLSIRGMYYLRNNLAGIGEGEFDAVLGVRYQAAFDGEVATHVVNVLVEGREVGWIHRDERLLGIVRQFWDDGAEPHTLAWIRGSGEDWVGSVAIPNLAGFKRWLGTPVDQRGSLDLRPSLEFGLSDEKALQDDLKAVRRIGGRRVTASISTEPETVGKYAGQPVYVFAVDGVVVGRAHPRNRVQEISEAFGNGVTEALVTIEGAYGAISARATMKRHPE